MNKEMKILIADDEEIFLESMKAFMGRNGYQCDAACDALQAMQKLKASPYDLLITDINMPGNSRLELLQDVAAEFPSLQVIIVTANPSVDTALEALKLSVAGYLVKPFSYHEFLNLVEITAARLELINAVQKTRERIESWDNDLKNFQNLAYPIMCSSLNLMLPSFIDLSIRNIAGSLMDISSLLKLSTESRSAETPCHLLGCPREKHLTDALKETIEVLEKTKGAFKSKDLAELRKKLESHLKKDILPS
ncbi:MAG: response regulator [Candidatus Xenobiia bacterium LiM19]